MFLLFALIVVALAFIVAGALDSRSANFGLLTFSALVLGTAGATIGLIAWNMLAVAVNPREEDVGSYRLKLGDTSLRLLYGLCVGMIGLALGALAWLFWDSTANVLAGRSQSPTDPVLLFVILIVLAPPLGLLALNLIRMVRDPNAATRMPTLGRLGRVVKWSNLAQLVLSALLLLAALGLWQEGQYSAAVVLGVANTLVILQYILTRPIRTVLHSIGVALILIGLLWLAPLIQGLVAGNRSQEIGGLILWLVFTVLGLMLTRVG